MRKIVGNRRDGTRRVGPHARQFVQTFKRRGKFAAKFVCDDLRRLVQIARACVVAKPGPGGEHIVQRRIGQRFHIRPERKEFAVVTRDRLHRRLLQHDLRQPDMIGIGAAALRRAPRQGAAVDVVPGEQRLRVNGL